MLANRSLNSAVSQSLSILFNFNVLHFPTRKTVGLWRHKWCFHLKRVKNFTIFFSNATTCSYELSCSPSPGCGGSVTDFWGRDAHEAQLRCPDGGRGDIGKWGARRGLKYRSTNYPDHGHHRYPPPTRKIPMVEPGIETRDLVISSHKLWPLDQEAGQFYKTCCEHMPLDNTKMLCF